MKVKAIFNRDGGTFRTTDMEAYGRTVEEVF
ncbi:MAG TPA: diacylglycerol kinase family lipid kinase, partial [Sinorhizobium sp.]|nr:diacylglycerol kinase family lipid kinase [Sinorhizobium sp.]